MIQYKYFKIFMLLLFSFYLFTPNSFSGFNLPQTDGADSIILYMFDLRDRESYIQLTSSNNQNTVVHIQVFDVSNNCNENDFFDNYTPNDTHIYNLRDITTNDGNPSGVVLPENSYGIVAIGVIDTDTGGYDLNNYVLNGNLRILDISGYEYRSNAIGISNTAGGGTQNITFNFDNSSGVSFSDLVVMPFFRDIPNGEILAADITEYFIVGDIDIFNENENIFSCRNVIFACTDQDNPLLGALLEETSGDDDDDSASVASYEYGINNAIPHSRNGELLCPGNIIDSGIVRINGNASSGVLGVFGFIGLNNGNGRGSLDSFWNPDRNTSLDPRG